MNSVDISRDSIGKAVEVLKNGGVVVAPTDSVYGLFGDALNEKTVNRIKEIKGRESGKRFQIAVLKEDAGSYGRLGEKALKLIEHFWPGDVNIIVRKTVNVPDYLSEDTICLTCHKNKVVDELVRKTGKPLVSTSVNLAGMPPAVKVGDIVGEVSDKVDLILDGGETKNKRPNTIIDLTSEPARLLREGPVSIRELEKVI